MAIDPIIIPDVYIIIFRTTIEKINELYSGHLIPVSSELLRLNMTRYRYLGPMDNGNLKRLLSVQETKKKNRKLFVRSVEFKCNFGGDRRKRRSDEGYFRLIL